MPRSSAEPLTEEELAGKEALETSGFGHWNKRHFQNFIKGLTEHGRNDLAAVANMIGEQDLESVQAYAKVFWQRYKEIAGMSINSVVICDTSLTWCLTDWEKHIERIDSGEKGRLKRQEEIEVLRLKVDGTSRPLQTLSVVYGQNKGKHYSEEEDRFILVRLCHWGEFPALMMPRPVQVVDVVSAQLQVSRTRGYLT